jgi:hypothetical protein
LPNALGWGVISMISGNGSETVGFAAMIVALSMVYFGVRSFRDKENAGIISFKDAFGKGLVIVLVASIIYTIGWEVYYPNFAPEFYNEYAEKSMSKYDNQGLTKDELELKRQEVEEWMATFKNPMYRLPMTFLEIFPVGLVIALFSALLLKRKPVDVSKSNS